MTTDARDLLRDLVSIEHRVAVWCAAQCARLVLRSVPEGEDRPRLAIEAAERWAMAPSARNLSATTTAARAAYAAAYDLGVRRHPAAANASDAAAYAAATASHSSSPTAASYAARSVFYAAAYAALSEASMLTLCLSQRWPLTPLSPEQRSRLRPSHQVALDYLDECDLPETLTVAQLIEAHEQRGALLWSTSTGRAIAERLVLVDEARRIRGVEIVNYGGAP